MKDFHDEITPKPDNSSWNTWAKYVILTIGALVEKQEKDKKEFDSLNLDFQKFKTEINTKIVVGTILLTIVVQIIIKALDFIIIKP